MFFRRFACTSVLPPTIRQLLSAPSSVLSSSVAVTGWVRSVRRQKNVAFAAVNDGSSSRSLQAVFADPGAVKSLTNGVSVRLRGRLVDSIGAGQARELQVEEVEMLGESDPETYPMQKQTLSVEHLRDHCHFRPRTDASAAMLRLRDSTMRSFLSYFEEEGFCHVHAPIMTSNDCEGAGDTFRVTPASAFSDGTFEEFFSCPSYLTVSSQLHLEALASSLSRVYTLAPCFRSERSMTNRHLAEFWMLEAEWAFVDGIQDVCTLVESVVKRTLQNVAAQEDLETLWRGKDAGRRALLDHAAREDRSWARMTYTDAVEALRTQRARVFEFAPAWGQPLQSEHERWLADELVRGPVFVTDYPASMKPFYARKNDKDGGQTVACFDLLIPYLGELAGGSVREERLDMLESAFSKHGLNRNVYEWYLDLRRYGAARSGGFGLGFERMIGWLGGIDNIRECIAIPRWTGRMLL